MEIYSQIILQTQYWKNVKPLKTEEIWNRRRKKLQKIKKNKPRISRDERKCLEKYYNTMRDQMSYTNL